MMTRHSLFISSANALLFFKPLRFCSKAPKPFPPPKSGSWVWRYSVPSMGVGLNWQRRIFSGVKCHTQHNHSNAVVVAGDESYGNKQVVSVTPQLYDYILAHVREPQILRELREETSRMPGSQMQVDVRCALAVDSLQDLLHNGEANSYDFAFLDADKRMYHEYYELLFQLIRPGGLLVIDNVLWHGKVADPLINDKKTVSLRAFNKAVFNDKRVSISTVPIGDGMTLCWKR